jgi:hypothetical protein
MVCLHVDRTGPSPWGPIEVAPSILARRRLGHRAVWAMRQLLGVVLVLGLALWALLHSALWGFRDRQLLSVER